MNEENVFATKAEVEKVRSELADRSIETHKRVSETLQGFSEAISAA